MSTIPTIPRDRPLPVSFTQEERLTTGRHVQFVNNKIAIGLLFDGPLDTALLDRALAELTDRHEALRLTFPDEEVLRAALLPRLPALRHVRVDGGDPEQRLDRALALLAEDACAPFDLAAGPLCRTLLAEVEPDRHVLCVTIDHVVTDAWSVRLVLEELLLIYRARAAGATPDLPGLPVQYPDFVAWERAQLSGAALERQVGYWRRKLAGIDPIPSSGLTDPAGEPGGAPRLVKLRTLLDRPAVDRLTGLAADLGTSLVVLVSAAVKAAMWRRRRATMGDAEAGDVATFGSLANRTRPDTQRVVGYLATVATFRTAFDGTTPFRELAGREARTLWEAMRHQRIPHSLIMRELRHPQYGARYRDPASLPSYLNFDFDLVEDSSQELPRVPGLDVRPIAIPMPEVPRGGLRVLGYRRPNGVELELRYRSDRYGPAWAAEFLDDIARVLHVAVDAPDVPVGQVFEPAARSAR
ncbi:condensation domain-containing protein [Actinosynnema sp. NPDC059335]|uniref:condensation domain-containing protein n=1 Tax=Actinosynnema sp. NPDC059335 TaxID=3346804 RepID=UPI00366FA27B